MFNIGAGELIFITVAALLILGPQRLPEFARLLGRFTREFRRQTDEVRTVVEREMYTMDQELNREQGAPPLVVPQQKPQGKGDGHLLAYRDAGVEPAPVLASAAPSAVTPEDPPAPLASVGAVEPVAPGGPGNGASVPVA
jgi:sec-independent protein translocase protein TatB